MAGKDFVYTIGRRKTSVATIRLFGTAGKSTVNEKPLEQVFGSSVEKVKLSMPFDVAELDLRDFMYSAKVNGGGHNSQLEAIVLGLARAIVKKYPEKKKQLKVAGLLTRDPRMVERKKPGLRKARKAEQYSKR